MLMHKHLKHAKRQVLSQQFDSGTEHKILKFWREYDPKRVEDLLFKGILKRTLALTANVLWDMQMDFEKSENCLRRWRGWRHGDA